MIKFKKYNQNDLEHLQKLELKILKDVISVCETYDLKYYAYGGTALGAIRHGGFIPWDDDVDIALFREDYEKLLKIIASELSEKYYLINSNKYKDYISSTTQVCLKGTTFKNNTEPPVSFDRGIFIDLFPLDNVPESKTKRKIQRYIYTIIDHLLINLTFEVKSSNKLYSTIHSLMHKTLKVIPGYEFIRKQQIKCLTKYNGKKTNYCTVFALQNNFLNFGMDGFFDKRDFEPPKKVKFEDIKINMPHNYDNILTTHYGDYMTLPPEEKRFNHSADILDFGKY